MSKQRIRRILSTKVRKTKSRIFSFVTGVRYRSPPLKKRDPSFLHLDRHNWRREKSRVLDSLSLGRRKLVYVDEDGWWGIDCEIVCPCWTPNLLVEIVEMRNVLLRPRGNPNPRSTLELEVWFRRCLFAMLPTISPPPYRDSYPSVGWLKKEEG